MADLISHEQLLERIHYDPETGQMKWVKTVPGSHMRPGDTAGTFKHRTGYGVVRIGPRGYMMHRLAWFYVHGDWPIGHLDHANGDIRDNRIANLRIATRSQNMANRRIRYDNTTGFKGVTRSQGRFAAEIKVRGNRLWLGRFDTAEEAHQAYAAAAVQNFGEFARAG